VRVTIGEDVRQKYFSCFFVNINQKRFHFWKLIFFPMHGIDTCNIMQRIYKVLNDAKFVVELTFKWINLIQILKHLTCNHFWTFISSIFWRSIYSYFGNNYILKINYYILWKGRHAKSKKKKTPIRPSYLTLTIIKKIGLLKNVFHN